jgi:hypothetical protein
LSFARPFSEAMEILHHVQKEKTDGMSGEASSPVRDGAETPGTSMAHPIAELVPRRTKVHTRTSSLERSYGSTGSHTGSESSAKKGYSSGEMGKKNLRGH